MSSMDANRKRLREEFEKKLSAASNSKSSAVPSSSASSSSYKQGDNQSKINKIRQESRNRLYEANNSAMNNAYEQQHQYESVKIQKQAACEIKVKWKLSGMSESDDSLFQKFKIFGHVKEIILHKSKGNVANIVFDSEESVQKAVSYYENSSDYRVTSVLEDKKSKIFTFNYKKDTPRHSEIDPSSAGNGDANYSADVQDNIGGLSIASSFEELIALESLVFAELELVV